MCAFIAILHRLLAVSDKSFDLNVLRLHSGVWDGFLWGGRLLLWRTAFRACRACLRAGTSEAGRRNQQDQEGDKIGRAHLCYPDYTAHRVCPIARENKNI